MADADSTPVKKCKHGHEQTPGNVYVDKHGCPTCKVCRKAQREEFGKSHILWNTYKMMISRCTSPANKNWKRYGGRGIVVCDRWLKSYDNFAADMGPKPTPKHTLERKNNNLGYNSDNCEWATSIKQSRNTSRNRILDCEGRRMPQSEWAEITGLTSQIIHNRIHRSGWTTEEALTIPKINSRLRSPNGSFVPKA